MNIYGVGVVQNEADVLPESVPWAARFCRRLRIWDLGSRDDTWEVLQSLAGPNIEVARREDLTYSSSLRGAMANEWRSELEHGDWIYIFDADEFLVGDPRLALASAEAEGAALVGAWQANFFPTPETLRELDRLGEEAWSRLPLAERFRYYRVEWFEWRFVRLTPDLIWETHGPYNAFRRSDGGTPKRSRQRLVVRHYRYRSPAQVRQRFETRVQARQDVRRFRYDLTDDFRALVRPARAGCLWPDPCHELVVPTRELIRARIRIGWVRLLRKWQRLQRRA